MGFDIISFSSSASALLMCLLAFLNWHRLRRRHTEDSQPALLAACLTGCASPMLLLLLGFGLVLLDAEVLHWYALSRALANYDTLGSSIVSALLAATLAGTAFHFVVLARTALDPRGRIRLTLLFVLILLLSQAAILTAWNSGVPKLKYLFRDEAHDRHTGPYDE